MRAKPQVCWALIGAVRGYIKINSLAYSRNYVIAAAIKEWRGYGPSVNGNGLTDAQFWRWLKKHNGWEVRRIEMRVQS